MIGFILPNEGSNKTLREFTVSVDAVEKATGLDFFLKVPKPYDKCSPFIRGSIRHF